MTEEPVEVEELCRYLHLTEETEAVTGLMIHHWYGHITLATDTSPTVSWVSNSAPVLAGNTDTPVTWHHSHHLVSVYWLTSDTWLCVGHMTWYLHCLQCVDILYFTCTVLYCTIMYCTILYCTVLYCNILCCFVFSFTVLYCIVYMTPSPQHSRLCTRLCATATYYNRLEKNYSCRLITGIMGVIKTCFRCRNGH